MDPFVPAPTGVNTLPVRQPLQPHPHPDTPHAFLLSPNTRRRQRGRTSAVLDNVTATLMTNQTVLSTEILNTLHSPIMLNDQQIRRLSHGPSPDEQVIQARGRRQIPLTFSPDVHTTPLRYRGHRRASPATGSPADGSKAGGVMPRLLLPTRSSPRKRLTLTDSPPANSSKPVDAATSSASPVPSTSASPAIFNTPSPDSKSKRASPLSKKFKLADDAASAATADPAQLMRGLSHAQLIGMFSQLMKKRPDLRGEVAELMPAPDLGPLEERLNYLKRNIYKSRPSTRLESPTGPMAYNRVATHLLAFKKAVLEQGKQLLEAGQWVASVDYTVMAWSYVRATPVWENPVHNSVRKACFKSLASNCMQALKKGKWERNADAADVLVEIKNKLAPLEKDSEDITLCLRHLDTMITNSSKQAAAE